MRNLFFIPCLRGFISAAKRMKGRLQPLRHGLSSLIFQAHQAVDKACDAAENANEAADAANEAAGSVNEALSNAAEAIDGPMQRGMRRIEFGGSGGERSGGNGRRGSGGGPSDYFWQPRQRQGKADIAATAAQKCSFGGAVRCIRGQYGGGNGKYCCRDCKRGRIRSSNAAAEAAK